MHWWFDGWSWFWMAPMMVFWLLLLGVAVWAIARLVGSAERDDRRWDLTRPQKTHEGHPRDILDRRLASGEIDREEYERLREVIDRRRAREETER